MSRLVPPSLAVFGLLIFMPGIVLFVFTLNGLNPDEVAVAQTPVATIPLDQVGRQPSTAVNITIPDNAQWKRIRRDWGEPDFIISAVSSERQLFAYCLEDLEMGVEVYEHGKPIPIESYGPGYGYSTDCQRSSGLKFRAAPRAELRVVISRLGPRSLPLGNLIVVGRWFYEKDKIVGDELDGELRPFFAAPEVVNKNSGTPDPHLP